MGMTKLTIIFLLLTGYATAQVTQQNDSLLMKLQTAKADTNKVKLLFAYGEQFENSLPDSALFYYAQAKALSQQLNYTKGLFTYCSYTIVILNNQGRFKEALELCKATAALYKKDNNPNDLAAIYINTGSEWQYLSDLQAAAENYIKAAALAEQSGNTKFQRVAYNNLASVFNTLQQYEKGKQYAKKSLAIATQMKDDYAIASSTINIATSENFLKQYDSSLLHFTQVEALGKKMADEIIVMDGWLGKADNLLQMGNSIAAEKLYRDVIKLSQQKAAAEYELYGYMGISHLLVKLKQYHTAQPFIAAGIPLAQLLGTKIELKDLYLRASELFEATGKPAQALQFHKQFVALNDTLLNEKNTANINLLEIKYETSKKENQIKQLEADKQLQLLAIKQKNVYNYILLGSAASILLIAGLSYRNYRHKQLLQQQRIAELEKEKLLLATEAVLQGQEEERSRLAKDLHDGLGGMLSSVKYSFSHIKENLVMAPDNMQRFERSLDMLDSSIKEMRRVAHSMMPEALLKFGLDVALKDFCTSINTSGVLQIVYQSHGVALLALAPTVNVTIYRVVQELVNNSIKHAAATTAIVQLNVENNMLHITVEDNGKGFDTQTLAQAAGMGWSNISSRLNYLKATTDVQSEPGKGTSVWISMAL
jgi:two-component system, NarL family, sensor kinase